MSGAARPSPQGDQHDEADQNKLVQLVSGDPAVSAAVLRTVNSPADGLSRTTGSIQQALTIIGLRATANLLSRLLFRQAFPEGSGTVMRKFREESSRLTETAAEIARRVPGLNADEATTYMVYRDCGLADDATRRRVIHYFGARHDILNKESTHACAYRNTHPTSPTK